MKTALVLIDFNKHFEMGLGVLLVIIRPKSRQLSY